MSKIYKKYGSSFKMKVALEALKERKTVTELCQKYNVTANQIFAWKKKLEERSHKIFADKQNDHKEEISKLHRVIGQLEAERDFLKHVLKR